VPHLDLFDFGSNQIALIALLFVWAGFVRSGLGFGGAALGLPLMLFIDNRPLFWLPIIGTHLLFFSALTLRTRMNDVDWRFLRFAASYVIPAALVGIFGLLHLPNRWLLIFIYSVTLLYALLWLLDLQIRSDGDWVDRFLLVAGGYVAGTSLSGAPIMVAVFMRNIAPLQLRNTMFVLWFVLVSVKMSTFAAVGVKLHFATALALIPVAAIGHVVGLRSHDYILRNDRMFRRVIGGVLFVICALGFWRLNHG
jgi:uncharacterized membrane protein YfcA